MKLDTQQVELIGRNRLIDELLRAGLEIALPLRDRGIDLIAFSDTGTFRACPIQMKAAMRRTFSYDQKYERFGNLLIAFVWFVEDPTKTATYALTFQETKAIADELGWLLTVSGSGGYYANTNPSNRVTSLLEQHLMTPERWRQKVIGLTEA